MARRIVGGRTRAARGATSAMPSCANSATTACFELERCAARYFGIRTFAAHINGLVRTDDGIRMWLGRRSPHKAVDPGLLDNMVGGGIAAGASVEATVIKEAWRRGRHPCRARRNGAQPQARCGFAVHIPRAWSAKPSTCTISGSIRRSFPWASTEKSSSSGSKTLSDAARLACQSRRQRRRDRGCEPRDRRLPDAAWLHRRRHRRLRRTRRAAPRFARARSNACRSAYAALIAVGAICLMPSSRSASRTAFTAWRISSGPMAPMQPTRNVSTCVNLPG